MTVALYARRKNWPLDETIVRLQHSKVHATDCSDCETKAVRLDRVDWTLQFNGRLTGAQQTRLLEIAQRCPVHGTLASGLQIPVPELVEGSPASSRFDHPGEKT